jgi:mannose-6-phosphate isomerase
MSNDPITFEPIFMERPWGGRRLETLLHFPIPPEKKIGELWAIVDRTEAESLVATGPLQGETLHKLWRDHREEIFGLMHLENRSARFPLLCKILDATETLSLQVHPPASQAAQLGGEPKAECWYILESDPGATIFVGLRRGVTRESFQQALKSGDIESTLHRLAVHAGESIALPSGRLHALGRGNVVVEIQQNSDTTYRVFDWNRQGLDGKPRQLQIPESLASIDFEDYEPSLQPHDTSLLDDSPYFQIEKWSLERPRLAIEGKYFALVSCLSGLLRCGGQLFRPGQFFLVPASMEEPLLVAESAGTTLLRTLLK